MSNYTKTQVSPNDATKLAIHSILRAEDDLISNFGGKFIKIVSFDDIVHLIDDENIMNYVDFDCGITIYPLKNWVISGNPEQWMEFRRLWWTVLFFKCSYLFQLSHFY